MSVTNYLFQQNYSVSRKDREDLNGHIAFTVWFSGFSGSGKSTLAAALDQWFFNRQIRSYITDGDNTRMHLNRDLDFSREGRKENIRRVAEVARLFNDAGVVVISSFISPFEEDRISAKSIVGPENYIEVYIATPLETCIQRDAKGLYAKAQKGEISDFTGINSPYEIPVNPDIIVDTTDRSIETSLEIITSWLLENKLQPKVQLKP
ncbi:adenylylsulfate kinase/bifunctional enzyme CysN/CysC [Flavobacterium glycines]|uniref:Adenylyl-sulfate kinase n=1 Tax=Flavobacterium glycines TaxID=551990 RepID=A0A1B9DNX1_9FLAO|nr:adenylyl-sulfate kinase [Flavobacterium glycines]OCB71389.1 adenylyl-sulfate kinase [Flavobacterium glycines]GEL10409.1 adenylyl-sulfate kinase [Flavobacterium glycines]SDI69113.1 adenylylsulfate kinase/bifunctional enzyme CysN/CysC [Flavobacterium glycines]